MKREYFVSASYLNKCTVQLGVYVFVATSGPNTLIEKPNRLKNGHPFLNALPYKDLRSVEYQRCELTLLGV